MGFDALYISPFVENTKNGYHGYWAQNIYKVNEHFGTEEDLKALVKEAHKRDIYVRILLQLSNLFFLSGNG